LPLKDQMGIAGHALEPPCPIAAVVIDSSVPTDGDAAGYRHSMTRNSLKKVPITPHLAHRPP
jgi:hypothetical protein